MRQKVTKIVDSHLYVTKLLSASIIQDLIGKILSWETNQTKDT